MLGLPARRRHFSFWFAVAAVRGDERRFNGDGVATETEFEALISNAEQANLSKNLAMLRSGLPFYMVPFTTNDLNFVKPECVGTIFCFFTSDEEEFRTEKFNMSRASSTAIGAKGAFIMEATLYREITCFMPNFIPKDDIKKIITSIGESDTTDQLSCEAETSHGPTWLVGRHVKPPKKKEKKYYFI